MNEADLASLLAAAPPAHRRTVATTLGLPPAAPAEAIANALRDPDRIVAIVRGLSPSARYLAAEAAWLGEAVVEENWASRRPSNAAAELERHGLAFAFEDSYWLKHFVPTELHPLLADALAAPYARDIAAADAERWLDAPLQLAHDIASLWAYLTRSTVRVKTDGGVYKRDVPKLVGALPPLALHDGDEFMGGLRLSFVLAVLAEERLVRVRVNDLPSSDERRELAPASNPAALLAADAEDLRARLLRHAPRVPLASPALALANALAPGATVDLASFGAALRTLLDDAAVEVPEATDFSLGLGGLHFPWLVGAVSLGVNHDGLPTAVRAPTASIGAAGRLICQSNFELIALSPPTPAQRLVLALVSEPVPDQAHVFRITRRSVQAAQRSGVLEGGVIAALERLVGELPQNVARSMADWTSSVRRPLRLRTAMMVDAGDPGTADEVAGELGAYVVERLGPSHLAIRSDDVRAVEAALRRVGRELDPWVDRVSGGLRDREPTRTETEVTWQPDTGNALPAGKQISSLDAVSAVPRPQPTQLPAGAVGTGGVADGPDWQSDPAEAVLDAIERGTDVLIVYAGARGTTLRQITPHTVEGAAVHAYCHMRGEERSFWLASIQEAVPLD